MKAHKTKSGYVNITWLWVAFSWWAANLRCGATDDPATLDGYMEGAD